MPVIAATLLGTAMRQLGPDNAFWIDGEWIGWNSILDPEDPPSCHLEELERIAELRFKYPNADVTLIPYFNDLLELASTFHFETGRHLNVYGDIGELFGAITYGIRLNRNYAQGSDGRLGKDHVEIKTITPFKNSDVVTIDRSGNFNKLLVVKIDEAFQVRGRMVDRSKLPKGSGRYFRVKWTDLPAS
jgi:hypothetical protein